MNLVFHIATGIGVVVSLTDTSRVKEKAINKIKVLTGFFVFIVAVILHGVLDYIPHCYPLNAKPDVILCSVMFVSLIFVTNRRFKFIMFLALLGSIFPDLIDHSTLILNRFLRLNLPMGTKLFPWHWEGYSGSLYHQGWLISTINHIALLITLLIICWQRRLDFRTIFTKKE